MQFVSDWRECFSDTLRLLTRSEPIFLSRIGGSDTNAVACFLQMQERPSGELEEQLSHHKMMVQRFNGFYDTRSDAGTFIKYLNCITECYEATSHTFLCNYQLLSMYLPDNIAKPFFRSDIEGRRGFELLMDRVAAIRPDSRCYPYTFVEKVVSHPLTLFNVFGAALEGKRVLVVSPFAESIETNFHRRASFFKNYDYPDFTLAVCNVPITYAGLPAEFYPDADWFDTVERLKRSVSEIQFDIALLSCGSYALPIGRYICEELGRKSVYVGGVLQLFFGVTGRRYAGNQFFENQMNLDSFIYPLEGERYLRHVSIASETAREAFGAYF